MARLSGFLVVALFVGMLLSASANTIVYNVTFVACVQGSTCPQGNPSFFSQTFALNGSLSPNLTLNVGDQLQFNLATTVSIHPLTICQNSPIPNFCKGITNGTDLLNTPITQAGTSTTVTFTTAGTYYYGCQNHPGMGAIITVVQTSTAATATTVSSVMASSSAMGSSSSAMSSSSSMNTTSSSLGNTGARYQLSASFLFLTVISLLAVVFI